MDFVCFVKIFVLYLLKIKAMENNLFNKTSFYKNYVCQKILYHEYSSYNPWVVSFKDNSVYQKSCYIELKSTNNISDEEYMMVSQIENDSYTECHLTRGKAIMRTFNGYYDAVHSMKNSIQLIHLIDFLRSRGYAVPWMGLTVEKQIEYGWIKLTN